MALRGLHRLPRLPVHRPAHNYRPVLLSENRRQVPQLADQKPGDLDGDRHVDHPGPPLLHQHLRLGALHRLPGPRARPVRRPVPQGPDLQHRPNHRLLLDHPRRALHPVRRHLQNRLRHAEEKRSETAQNAVHGGVVRRSHVRDGGLCRRDRYLQASNQHPAIRLRRRQTQRRRSKRKKATHEPDQRLRRAVR